MGVQGEGHSLPPLNTVETLRRIGLGMHSAAAILATRFQLCLFQTVCKVNLIVNDAVQGRSVIYIADKQ
jgi:hypothetical protein